MTIRNVRYGAEWYRKEDGETNYYEISSFLPSFTKIKKQIKMNKYKLQENISMSSLLIIIFLKTSGFAHTHPVFCSKPYNK